MHTRGQTCLGPVLHKGASMSDAGDADGGQLNACAPGKHGLASEPRSAALRVAKKLQYQYNN